MSHRSYAHWFILVKRSHLIPIHHSYKYDKICVIFYSFRIPPFDHFTILTDFLNRSSLWKGPFSRSSWHEITTTYKMADVPRGIGKTYSSCQAWMLYLSKRSSRHFAMSKGSTPSNTFRWTKSKEVERILGTLPKSLLNILSACQGTPRISQAQHGLT